MNLFPASIYLGEGREHHNSGGFFMSTDHVCYQDITRAVFSEAFSVSSASGGFIRGGCTLLYAAIAPYHHENMLDTSAVCRLFTSSTYHFDIWINILWTTSQKVAAWCTSPVIRRIPSITCLTTG